MKSGKKEIKNHELHRFTQTAGDAVKRFKAARDAACSFEISLRGILHS